MKPTKRDYSLLGRDAETAVANGLAAAEWYHTDVPRKEMKALMQRSDAPAIRDTAIWLGCLVVSGALGATPDSYRSLFDRMGEPAMGRSLASPQPDGPGGALAC